MTIEEILDYLETIASPAYQESYDNAGLITGSPAWNCTGVLVSLDVTEAVVHEAVAKKCNLIVAHHPIIFKGLKRLTGSNYVERTVIAAIKYDIAIYALHTNLDNVLAGVNGKIADALVLVKRSVLEPKSSLLKKLYTFVPKDHAEAVRQSIFEAGGGVISNYSECSFNTAGAGTFKAGAGTDPFVGKLGERHTEQEIKIEVIFPAYLEEKIVSGMKVAHPYEEVAYDIIPLANVHPGVGSGMIGELATPMTEISFLTMVKQRFNLTFLKHTPLLQKPVKRVAVCGGAGSFLISTAMAQKADVFITADITYHQFFDADNRMIIIDIGHYESEQYTINLIYEQLQLNFSSFAILKTEVNTNPVHYFSH